LGAARYLRRAAVVVVLAMAVRAEAAEDAVTRGAYLVRAAGCVGCHTDAKGKGPAFAGGRALKTPFGIYYTPNITPDKETGIGGWSDQDFLNALRQGLRPDGSHYLPVFPYTTYTRMRDADALAIKAYLFSLKPVSRQNRAHDVWPPFDWRWTMGPWKWLYFEPGRWRADAKRDKTWNRGAYLVEALAHCAECHSPRNLAGALDREMWMAGTEDGPEGEIAANITPDAETGIGDWNEDEIVTLLSEGIKPDYDDVQGTMAEAIEDGLAHLSPADLAAIAVYIKSLPPIRNKVGR
jgi:mono/diheme cytochrome c family protein